MTHLGTAGWFALVLATFGAAPHAVAGLQFKCFPETVSPDGAYLLAWGPLDEKGDPNAAAEVPYEDEAFDQAAGDIEIANYVVEAATRKIVAEIPEFEQWAGPNWHKNHDGLEIAWTRDSRKALAISDSKWGSAAVAWIEPPSRKAINVRDQLEKAFSKVLRKHEPTFKDYQVSFWNPALVRPDRLVVHAAGTIPKERDTANYLLKFKIVGEGEKVRFELESGRRRSEETDNGDAEATLNTVYNRVRQRLPKKDREALRDEQTNWLKQREAIPGADARERFTRHRIGELRAMLD